MATRMQQRRGTAAQWTAADPILAAGEIGFETDTNQFKIGDGVNEWADLSYFKNLEDLGGSLDDYVPVDTKGQANGVASLDSTGNIPMSQLGNLIDGAPDALNTLNEIADALDNNGTFASTIITSIATKLARSGGAMGGTLNMSGNPLTNVPDPSANSDAATKGYVDSVSSGNVSSHNTATTNVHGIANTANLVTSSDIANFATTSSLTTVATDAGTALTNHNLDTTEVHGISNTANLVYNSTVTAHTNATTSVHGITDTAALATKTYADGAVSTAVSTLTKSSVGLANVDNTSDANKPVSSATSTALALKASLASPTFTGTVSGITKSMVGLSNVDNTADSAKPVSTAQQTALDAKLALAGGTMTGALTLSGAPTSDLHAATKQYVDGLAAGINFHAPVVAATHVNFAATYNNGTSGVGATLTSSTTGVFTFDGVTVALNDRILVKSQTNNIQNGIYTVSTLGATGVACVLTRATDSDNNPVGELANGDFCFVTGGSTNAAKGFIVSTTGTITIGTTGITYSQFNASEAVTAGTNITKTGATIAVADAPTFSGAITASSGVVFSDGTQTKEGVISRTPIVQKTASYTLSALTERDSLVEISSASGVTLTVPTNATVAYPVGTSIDILQTGAGQITVAGASGVTVNATPGLKLRTQWSGATLFKRATDTWVLYGDLSA
jgi:hypothetical protein